MTKNTFNDNDKNKTSNSEKCDCEKCRLKYFTNCVQSEVHDMLENIKNMHPFFENHAIMRKRKIQKIDGNGLYSPLISETDISKLLNDTRSLIQDAYLVAHLENRESTTFDAKRASDIKAALDAGLPILHIGTLIIAEFAECLLVKGYATFIKYNSSYDLEEILQSDLNEIVSEVDNTIYEYFENKNSESHEDEIPDNVISFDFINGQTAKPIGVEDHP